jgi:Family of unknown function (DUF5681)
MTDDASDEVGKVGYKRPPVHTRFQPGKSGNPRGRQKGVRNFAADVKHSLEIPVTVNEKGRPKRVSTQVAVILRAREKALKGDARPLEMYLGLARMHNNDDPSGRSGGLEMTSEDQAILDAYAEEIRSRKPAGAEPEPGISIKRETDRNE